MKDNHYTFTAKSMTADEVEELAHHVWMALVAIPRHRHRKTNERDCWQCRATKHLSTAYKMLPEQTFREMAAAQTARFVHDATCENDASCQCDGKGDDER
jgi:hypothetical protein